MLFRREWMVGLLGLGLCGAGSCAVFPDVATLPGKPGTAGAAGEGVSPTSASGGQGTDTIGQGGTSLAMGGSADSPAGAPAEGGSQTTTAGTGGTAGSGGHTGGASGSGGSGGTGGGGGSSSCVSPKQQLVAITADTWIESAKPSTNHGSDASLSVIGGGSQRRALLAFTLPVAPSGAVLRQATVSLHLQGNADAALNTRTLGLYELAHQFSETRATWTAYDNGNRKWVQPGGDFGLELANARTPTKTATGVVSFDVTSFLRNKLGAAVAPVSVIVLETGVVPAAPAELAFGAREGDASQVPTLALDFCAP